MSATANALIAALVGKAPGASLLMAEVTPWYSATFAGERHVVVLSFGDAVDVTFFRQELEDHEFSLASGIVADLHAEAPVVHAGAFQVRVEVLTIDGV